MKRKRRTDGLLVRFGFVFAIFSLATILSTAVSALLNQSRGYLRQHETSIRSIGDYLGRLINMDAQEFLDFQEYFIAHHDEINVPVDFDGDVRREKLRFEQMFQKQYPGKVMGQDVVFSELSDELKNAYATYVYERWMRVFEQTRDSYGLAYVYYIVPTGVPCQMMYVLDGVREPREGDEKNLLLGDVAYEDPGMFPTMWEAMETGEKPRGFDVFNNEYGHTMAYFSPLKIEGKTIGVIGAEITVEGTRREVIRQVALQAGVTGAIILVASLLLLYFINRQYISRIRKMEVQVREYTKTRDPGVAKRILQLAGGGDEVASLAKQVAEMILEIEQYMASLMQTSQALEHSKRYAREMERTAERDLLTGLRNKGAYDEHVKRIEEKMGHESCQFGIALIDLNFLKQLNDRYGHEKGDLAVKKLCSIVCTIYKHSPVFRIGGDEFVVVLQGRDYKNREALAAKLDAAMRQMQGDKTLEPWEAISAAMGMAVYDPAVDENTSQVFRRASQRMAVRKQEMKVGGMV